MSVLGSGAGLSVSGDSLVESSHPPRAIRDGALLTHPHLETPKRLLELHDGLAGLFEETKPDAVAMETLFTNRNLQTAMSVGRASGVVLLAAARAGVPVSEYVPTAVKSAVTGDGSAGKAQVQVMVARLLKLASPPSPADAADALAIALCHLRTAPIGASR